MLHYGQQFYFPQVSVDKTSVQLYCRMRRSIHVSLSQLTRVQDFRIGSQAGRALGELEQLSNFDVMRCQCYFGCGCFLVLNVANVNYPFINFKNMPNSLGKCLKDCHFENSKVLFHRWQPKSNGEPSVSFRLLFSVEHGDYS